MDYLKSFIIGTSPLITAQHFIPLALDKDKYKFSYPAYSIIAPLYYGAMSMLALYLGKKFNLSLRKRLFITSILSIIIVTLLVSRKKYESYKSFDTKGWISYALRNWSRHLIAFNLIMLFLEENFSKSYPLKVFIIGSSIFSYLVTYLKVMHLIRQNKVNYDYHLFTIMEPFGHGLMLLIATIGIQKLFGMDQKTGLFSLSVIFPVIWFIGIRYFVKTYNYTTKESIIAFVRVFITSFIKYNYVLRYLLENVH